ncbi:glycosyltransferase family 4 protein [Rugosimonospora africana]|nr:glycosyltransferase family 4 protein [Rugosimonospora africana]
MVHSSFAVRGGAEYYVRELSRELVARGHEVRVFCRGSEHREAGDHTVRRRFSARIPVLRKVFTHLGDLADPTGLSLADLDGFRPDVVHVHNWQGLGILPVARLSRRYPTCHTVHDHAIRDPNNALPQRGGGAPVNALLALRAAWLARQLRDVTPIWPSERTRDLVNARVPRALRRPGRLIPPMLPMPERDWAPGGRDVFLFLGALSPHKGISMLLDAWRAVAGEVGGTLLIAGEGPRRDEVEAAVRECPSIRYLGHLDTTGKVRAMQEAGWLVFPSQCLETFGMSCAEALKAGRPVISSDIASPPAASEDSVIRFGDLAGLRDALRASAGISAQRYQEMSASAAADGKRLDWAGHVDEVIGTYRALEAATVSGVGAA